VNNVAGTKKTTMIVMPDGSMKSETEGDKEREIEEKRKLEYKMY
jgi:hypothetical protein